jgi:hypothetical protein
MYLTLLDVGVTWAGLSSGRGGMSRNDGTSIGALYIAQLLEKNLTILLRLPSVHPTMIGDIQDPKCNVYINDIYIVLDHQRGDPHIRKSKEQ